MNAELVLASKATLGEGMNLFPDGRMRWVDLPNGLSYIWDGTSNELWHSQREEPLTPLKLLKNTYIEVEMEM